MKMTKMTMLRWVLFCVLGMLMLSSAYSALAQITNAVPSGDSSTPGLAIFQKVKPIEFLLIPLVAVVIQLVRKWVPAVPDNLWPFVGPFLGALIDYSAAKAGWATGNPAIGAMLGGLATWFHQLDKNSTNILDRLISPAPKEVAPAPPQVAPAPPEESP